MTLSLSILKQGSSTGPCTGGDYAASPGAIVGALIALNGIVVGSAHAEAGTSPKPYADYVDDVDQVWLSD